MTVANADMFDEAEDLGVPRHGQADIGHGQDRGHSGVRRRPVREHQVRLGRERDPRAIVKPAACCDPRGFTQPHRVRLWGEAGAERRNAASE